MSMHSSTRSFKVSRSARAAVAALDSRTTSASSFDEVRNGTDNVRSLEIDMNFSRPDWSTDAIADRHRQQRPGSGGVNAQLAARIGARSDIGRRETTSPSMSDA